MANFFLPVVGRLDLTKPPHARPSRTAWKPVPASGFDLPNAMAMAAVAI
jgi:hypothetical protein